MRERYEGMRAELRWGLGCLIASAAVVGAVLLVFIVSFYIQPPVWVQVLLGVGMVAGGVLLAWLVATALGQGRG